MRRTAVPLLLALILGIPTRFAPAQAQSPVVVQAAPRVNAPYFAGQVSYRASAIFWFGRVTPTENYTDVRVGYNDTELQVNLSVVDRLLWYDPNPSPQSLTAWDSAELFLNLAGNAGAQPGPGSYRLVSQFNWWEPDRTRWQAGYQGNGAGWVSSPVAFTTESGWRGDAPNDNVEDRGWTMTYHVPFASLGLAGPPARGTIWGLGVAVHDRDDAAGTPIADKTWPETMLAATPSTWGQLAFGTRVYRAPLAVPTQTSVIRQGLAGAIVPDGSVGGGTTCGDGLDFWTQWGEHNYAGEDHFNVQNQADVADWPCFSKYYVTFPLPPPPAGQVMIRAVLTLHEFGSAGAGWQPPPGPSYIQVLTVDRPWAESTLTWNNASPAGENVGGTWVAALGAFPGWPGIPYDWDVSWAAANAMSQGQPNLSLALYSADDQYHSGRYFTSSDAGDWDAIGRPTLTITWGQPVTNPRSLWLPLILSQAAH